MRRTFTATLRQAERQHKSRDDNPCYKLTFINHDDGNAVVTYTTQANAAISYTIGNSEYRAPARLCVTVNTHDYVSNVTVLKEVG